MVRSAQKDDDLDEDEERGWCFDEASARRADADAPAAAAADRGGAAFFGMDVRIWHKDDPEDPMNDASTASDGKVVGYLPAHLNDGEAYFRVHYAKANDEEDLGIAEVRRGKRHFEEGLVDDPGDEFDVAAGRARARNHVGARGRREHVGHGRERARRGELAFLGVLRGGRRRKREVILQGPIGAAHEKKAGDP